MLKRVLQEIEASQGAINLNELKLKLDVERSALDGMIKFWVCKRRLVDDDPADIAARAGYPRGSCGSSCPGFANCAFVAKLPKTYSLPSVGKPIKDSGHD